jgi:xanthine/uracil/vitamin C permease (AzgA family)
MSSNTTDQGSGQGSGPTRRAGAFDIRVFIALLIGIYGLVLLVVGIIGPSDAQIEKAAGLNINLWAGLGMVVVAAAFLLWARLRPVVVPEHTDSDEKEPRPS